MTPPLREKKRPAALPDYADLTAPDKRLTSGIRAEVGIIRTSA